MCRASGSTVDITRSGATLRAMRQRPSVPSEPSAGVSFHLCKSEVVHHRTAVGADRRSVL
ncbi:hypothetical protein BST10_22170 [Mycolicibacter algericus DSM 45454]|uniref:Uncharacterized protein n=1 Tax=Mycolicibacter algericus DSM 45454 TaxID=723879 RepID=A0ABX3R9R3_MYCAL|nr:hypothetical protein BST10_22170 [Mycolicibacter algericus DSM 45454]